MRGTICILCICLGAGAALLAGAVRDWRLARLRYLSCFKWGKIGGRLFTAGFGILLMGLGIMLILALMQA